MLQQDADSVEIDWEELEQFRRNISNLIFAAYAMCESFSVSEGRVNLTGTRAEEFLQRLEKYQTNGVAAKIAVQLIGKDIMIENQIRRVRSQSDLEVLLDHLGLEMPWTSQRLDSETIENEFLVDDVLVANQPGVIAGAFKSWKTTIAIELAVSLSQQQDFLGRFRVARSKRVLLFSAESGQATIQSTARRICRSKGVELHDCDISWGWWVPKTSIDTHLRALAGLIEHFKSDVVIIDPLYLSMSGDIQANLSMTGEQLDALTRCCLDQSATPVCVDHVKRASENAKRHEPLELSDISGAGKAEFFRQWLLIGRREKYDPEHAVSRLWATVGGSAGHCGQYAVDIDETRDTSGERAWGVSVELASEARADARADAATQKQRRNAASEEEIDEERLRKLRIVFQNYGSDPMTKSKAFAIAKLNNTSGGLPLQTLLDQQIIEEVRFPNPSRICDGYRLTK